MRAARIARYGDAASITVEQIEIPQPKKGQIRVRVHAAALNPIDTKIRAGYLRAIIRHPLPFTPGMDLSGTVDSIGEGVTRFRVGDAVFSSPSHRTMGAHAEFTCLDAREAALKPESLDHVQAASLPLAGLTAWDALVRHAKIEPGQKVLIQAGAGGVGTLAIQLAKSLGAEVLTTCSVGNIEFVRSLGADRVIDYKTQRYEEVARGCDVIIEAIGPQEFARAIATVKKGGTVVALSSGMPEAAQRFGPNLALLYTGLRIARHALPARLGRGVRFLPISRKPDGEALAELGKLVEAGKLKPVIDRVLSLEEIALGHARVESGRSRGKVVLKII